MEEPKSDAQEGALHILREERISMLLLVLGIFLLLSVLFPWPLLAINGFIDLVPMTLGIMESSLWDIPLIFVLMLALVITNIAWMREKLHSLLDSILLFIASFFYRPSSCGLQHRDLPGLWD